MLNMDRISFHRKDHKKKPHSEKNKVYLNVQSGWYMQLPLGLKQ